jgi:uncharacterized OsmC-like protein
VEIELEQIEGRRFVIRARGNEVIVDDTVEAGGPGDGFRPTELLLGALSACMAGTMANFANDQGVVIDGITVSVSDQVEKAPTRIGGITVSMIVRADTDERQAASLERVASACKIHNTLKRPPRIDVEFEVE